MHEKSDQTDGKIKETTIVSKESQEISIGITQEETDVAGEQQFDFSSLNNFASQYYERYAWGKRVEDLWAKWPTFFHFTLSRKLIHTTKNENWGTWSLKYSENPEGTEKKSANGDVRNRYPCEVSKTDWLLERTFSVGDPDGLAVGYEV